MASSAPACISCENGGAASSGLLTASSMPMSRSVFAAAAVVVAPLPPEPPPPPPPPRGRGGSPLCDPITKESRKRTFFCFLFLFLFQSIPSAISIFLGGGGTVFFCVCEREKKNLSLLTPTRRKKQGAPPCFFFTFPWLILFFHSASVFEVLVNYFCISRNTKERTKGGWKKKCFSLSSSSMFFPY